jgi:protein-S-isoprenylcysteine O-methyltransferase Ste14
LAGWAVALLIVYGLLAFGVRVGVALRTTGSTGIVRLRGVPPIEVLGGFLFIASGAMGVANPILVLGDVIDPVDALDKTPLHALGFAIAGVGIAGTFLAQMEMGSSWRIGVNESVRTDLVTGGIFSLCRNPIYTFMIFTWLGLALLVPTWLSIASVPATILAFEVQVRLVEEPYLLRAHGDAFRGYATRVGRFLPGLGRVA